MFRFVGLATLPVLWVGLAEGAVPPPPEAAVPLECRVLTGPSTGRVLRLALPAEELPPLTIEVPVTAGQALGNRLADPFAEDEAAEARATAVIAPKNALSDPFESDPALGNRVVDPF
jgi:hypothetical protein